jgi:hypothetical protein
VATGFRPSKVIGSSVVNDAGDTVGRVDASCWPWDLPTFKYAPD